MNTRSGAGGQHTRTFQVELGERKAGAKAFPAVLSTETSVKRRDLARGEFFEVLSHACNAVDLSRAPLPLLEVHNSHSLPVGVVENLRVVSNKLRGEVRFGMSARAQEIAADVDAGVIRNLSVGYSIEKFTEKRDGKVVTVTATRWTPHEASAVAIGADAGAGFGRNQVMENENENEPTTNTNDGAAVERQRCAAILSTARTLGVGDELPEQLIREGASVDEARARIIDRAEAQSVPLIGPGGDPSAHAAGGYTGVRGHRLGGATRGGWIAGRAHGVDTSFDFRAAASDAILLRAGIRLDKPHPGARDVNPSMLELARVCVSRAGRTVSGGDDRLIRSAMTTSDFPLLLVDAMHKAVRRGYEDEPASHREWVRHVPVADFRDQHRPILGSAPSLEQVNEAGEYTHGALSDDSTSYRVAKYGRIVELTWEAIRNDAVGAFMRVKPAMGQAARRKEADLVYEMFADNGSDGPTMQDGDTLFHANHNNVVVAASFTHAQLGLGRVLLRQQTALGGGYLSLVPKYLIVPAERESEAEILLAEATRHVRMIVGSAHQTDSATPKWIGDLELVVEPRLADGFVYLAADSVQIDTAELGLLDENQGGPVIEEEAGFVSDTYRWKVRHVMGAKFLDWRGMVRIALS